MPAEPTVYRNPTASVEARVADLLSRMDRPAKIGQLQSRWGFELLRRGVSDRMEDMEFSDELAEQLLTNGIGHISRNVGATNRGPRGCAEFANAVQRFLVERTRLGIPAIIHDECLCGVAGRGATQFPMMIGIASSFDPELVEQMASAIRTEMRAVGSLQGLAPVLDITRDPRWGRCEETFGEDAYLAARMGIRYVRGLQGELTSGVAATAKHFLGYGMAEGGLNHASTHIPTRELYEQVAFPFEAAIAEAKLASVMNSFSDLDGLPAISSEVLTELLRDRLGFTGHTVTDYTALDRLVDWHAVATDRTEAALIALEAGIDVELPSVTCYGDHLVEALDSGALSDDLLDRAVERILTTKLQLGLFEQPYVDADAADGAVRTAAHLGLARRLAEKSLVLLKNEHDLLPLDPTQTSIAVVGPNANNLRNQRGVFHYPAQLEVIQAIERIAAEAGAELPGPVASGGDLSLTGTTILDSIREAVSAGTVVRYAAGCDVSSDSTAGFAEAVAAAEASEVAIIVVGENSGMIPGFTNGEFHDRAELRLPGLQEDLINAVSATGTPVVVVLVTGRPPVLTAILDKASAILLAWLPGEEGGPAVADALFGTVNPGGKLPISLPRSVGQVPVYHNHKSGGGRSFPYGGYLDLPATPLFAFGHGLSYTTFELADLQISPTNATPDDCIEVSASVENTGDRAGDAVLQLYVRDLVATVARPVKELRGFQRVSLPAKRRSRVVFDLPVPQLGFYDRNMDFVVEPGDFEIAVGFSSDDIRVTGILTIAGDRPVSVKKVFAAESRVTSTNV